MVSTHAQPPEDVKAVLEQDFGWNPETKSFHESVDRVLLENQLGKALPDPREKGQEEDGEGDEGQRKRKKTKKYEDPSKIGNWFGPWAKPEIVPCGLSVCLSLFVPLWLYMWLQNCIELIARI
jgi:hypothetical protein